METPDVPSSVVTVPVAPVVVAETTASTMAAQPLPRPWSLPTLIAFRFFTVYYSLYVLTTQMWSGLLPFTNGSQYIDRVTVKVVEWVGAAILHVPAKSHPTGSGDTLYDWVQAFTLLVIAAIATAIWSIAKRRTRRYDRLYRGIRVFFRFALGSSMIGYGFAKAFPLQMPAPPLTRLLEPYGNFSPMGVLWYSIGASFPYERFVGLVEVVGGALMFFPRTALAGTLVLLGATFEVFMLNMTYDVPVKLFSFHLVVLSLVLLAPSLRHLFDVTFRDGARSRWAAVAQAVAGLLLLWLTGKPAHDSQYTYGQYAPKPPLYGIWNVDRMTINGVERAPLVTDYDRFRRVVIQSATTIFFWRMNDTPYGLVAKVDPDAHTISLGATPPGSGSFTYQQIDADHLVFDGTIHNTKMHMETTRQDHTAMPLLTRGFNWVQEFPFNK